MMDCKVKPDCAECRDAGQEANPNVLRAYACDLRRHGVPLDSGLPGVLERAANGIERLRDDLNAEIATHRTCSERLQRRELALRAIKSAHSRWYDGAADAEETVKTMEVFAVEVWMQESGTPNKAITNTPSANKR